MPHGALDQLLTTLEVRLHAFALCEIRRGFRLVFGAMDAVVIHYVIAGDGVIEAGGGQGIPFGPGSILIVPAGLGQKLAATWNIVEDVPAQDHCAMLADGLIAFDAAQGEDGDLRILCGTISATYGGSSGLFDALQGPLIEDMSGFEAVRRAFAIMLAERGRPTIGTHALTEALMKECLILLLREHLARLGTESALFSSLVDPRLSRAVMQVLDHPAAAHSVDRLAAAAGMSRSAFAKRFCEIYDQTPMEFVSRTRLHRAAALLRNTDLPVKLIASSLGYASRSHFSRAFRAAYRDDPTSFRRSMAQSRIDPPATVP
jgi:AraC-like DNA-binding protein